MVMSYKNDVLSGFEGSFSELLVQFVQLKQALGYQYIADGEMLKRFSRFSLNYSIKDHTLSKELVDAWTEKRPNERDVTREKRINNIRQFTKYLVDIGYVAYIPYCKTKVNRNLYVPYIFTQKQLLCFFAVCDDIQPHPQSNRHLFLPAIYRLLYGCGLRISEALTLQLKDVDLKNGIVTIHGAKFSKDRLTPMSPSLLLYLKKYFLKVHGVSGTEDYFFIKKDKSPIALNTVYKSFRKLLWQSGISHGGKGRGPRVHDFRHTFAVNSLNKMVREGTDLYCALPVLSTYLGHASVTATERYLRLTEEAYPGLLDSVDKLCSYIFPEVTDK